MITGTWTQRGVALHGLQDLVAVHLRHQDVEQHEVEGLPSHPVESLAPVRRAGHRRPLALQPALQHVPVHLVVVDDEDAAPRRRPVLVLVEGAQGGDGLLDHRRDLGVPGGHRLRRAGAGGELHDVVDEGQELLPRAVDAPEVLRRGLLAGGRRVLEEHLAVAEDGVDGGAEVVADARARLVELRLRGLRAQPGGVEDLVDELEQRLAGGVDLPEVVRPPRLARVLEQHLAVAEDGVDGGAQLVPDVGEEGAPGALGNGLAGRRHDVPRLRPAAWPAPRGAPRSSPGGAAARSASCRSRRSPPPAPSRGRPTWRGR